MTGKEILILEACPAVAWVDRRTSIRADDVDKARAAILAALPGITHRLATAAEEDCTTEGCPIGHMVHAEADRLRDEIADDTVARPGRTVAP